MSRLERLLEGTLLGAVATGQARATFSQETMAQALREFAARVLEDAVEELEDPALDAPLGDLERLAANWRRGR